MKNKLLQCVKTQSALYVSLLLTSQLCFAESIPDAGQLLREQITGQLNLSKQAALVSQPPLLNVLEGQQTVNVQKIAISGNTLFSQATLQQQVSEYQGQHLSLSQLQQVANRISDYYASKGYSFSYAFLPAQTLNNGTVTIQIVEAILSEVSIQNNSNTQSWLIQQMTQPLQSKQMLSEQKLDELSSRLGALNGIKSRFAIESGQLQNETRLTVELTPAQQLQAYVGLDNFGNEYSSEVRANAGVRLNSLLGLGDQFSFDMLSGGQRQNFGKIGYSAFVHGSGTQMGVNYSYLDYELGKNLKDLGYVGTAQQTSFWLEQPLLQSSEQQVIFNMDYRFKKVEDEVKAVQNYNHRNIQGVQLGINYSKYDTVGGAGINQLATSTTFGNLDIQDAVARQADALTRKSDGKFVTVTLQASRLQKVSDKNQLYTSIDGFYSPNNLDSAEAFYVGGANSVRGYGTSVLSGSEGFASTVEFRQDLWSNPTNQINAKVFFDAAKIKLNAQTWLASTEKNTAWLTGSGIGLDWKNRYSGNLKAEVGFPMGNKPDQLTQRDDHQVWLSWQKTY